MWSLEAKKAVLKEGALGKGWMGFNEVKVQVLGGDGEWRVGSGKVKPQAKESAHLKSKIQEKRSKWPSRFCCTNGRGI